MRILLTGSNGYLGSVLGPLLVAQGHEVVGLDCGFFNDCGFGTPSAAAFPCLSKDLRDVIRADLDGFEAVAHLAALSNDPLGNLNRELTLEINHAATVRLAQLAKAAGVRRFLFSSSCSMYGAAGDALLAENAPFAPVTPYAESKVLAEHDLALLADDRFSPVFLRNATAYGASPQLRLDLVLNDFVAAAYTTGRILILSDGTAWRPVVHAEDICQAFMVMLEAPREVVHKEAFNVGRGEENYRVSQLARIVAENMPGSRVEYAPGGSPDKRTYRVDFSKIQHQLPAFRPQWTVAAGALQLCEAYQAGGLTDADLQGPRYFRLRALRRLTDDGRLDAQLRWRRSDAPQLVSPAFDGAERNS
jgi:nucleoside-diphosphate-sugar epimerase